MDEDQGIVFYEKRRRNGAEKQIFCSCNESEFAPFYNSDNKKLTLYCVYCDRAIEFFTTTWCKEGLTDLGNVEVIP